MGNLNNYWVETSEIDLDLKYFIFINPTIDGKCTMIYNCRTREKFKAEVYYRICRKITETEYVTYKLLGAFDDL